MSVSAKTKSSSTKQQEMLFVYNAISSIVLNVLLITIVSNVWRALIISMEVVHAMKNLWLSQLKVRILLVNVLEI